MKMGFIGTGTLGRALAIALSYNKYSVAAVSNRTQSKAYQLAEVISGCEVFASPQDVLDHSDMIFITTPDDVIQPLVSQLRWSPQHSVIHCSGATSIDVLVVAKKAGAKIGSLHPFQTFACLYTNQDVLKRFTGITFAVEAEGLLLENLKTIVQTLGAQHIKIDQNNRALYHASGVMVSGHVVGLINATLELWQHMGFSRKASMDAIMPLIFSTIHNVLNQGVESSITGPMVRGDVTILENHIYALRRDFPELIDLYLSLSKACMSLKSSQIGQDNIKKVESVLNAKLNCSLYS
jgi:predicted short-subunit dehydrogenase-like oxidoreductase (DUF2520 family)